MGINVRSYLAANNSARAQLSHVFSPRLKPRVRVLVTKQQQQQQ